MAVTRGLHPAGTLVTFGALSALTWATRKSPATSPVGELRATVAEAVVALADVDSPTTIPADTVMALVVVTVFEPVALVAVRVTVNAPAVV